jgi:ATP-dependent Clp protease ATP-binding subunit ClpA
VVDKFLMQLEEQLHEKKVEAIFTGAQEPPGREGLRPADGRLIQDTIRARWQGH